MGIVLAALGGAGAALADAGSAMMKSDLDTERQLAVTKASSDLELQRQEALSAFNTAQGNQQREAQVARVNAAAQPIVEQGIVAKAQAARANQLPGYDPSDTSGQASFHGDAKQALADIQALPDSPDKQAALAQFQQNVAQNKARVGTLSGADLSDAERSQFAPSDAEMQKARMTAAISTGDISPEKAATLGQSSELTQMKMDNLLARADDRNATNEKLGAIRLEAAKYGADLRLQAAQEKAANGKIDTATSRMLITSEDANIRASTSQLNMLNTQLGTMHPTRDSKPNPEYASVQAQMESLRADIATSKATKTALFKSLGIQSDDVASNAAPAGRPPLTSFMGN